MFSAKTYQNRRKILSETVEDGLILLPGNNPVPMNYPSNHLRFRQDSNFLYYCGLDSPNLNMVIDTYTGESTLFGDDLSIKDIVWEGKRTSIKDMVDLAGIDHFRPNKDLSTFLNKPKQPIHFLPLYRADQKTFINSIFLLKSIYQSYQRKLLSVKSMLVKMMHKL